MNGIGKLFRPPSSEGLSGSFFPAAAGRYDLQLIELARIIHGEIENPYPLQHELLVQQCLLEACGCLWICRIRYRRWTSRFRLRQERHINVNGDSHYQTTDAQESDGRRVRHPRGCVPGTTHKYGASLLADTGAAPDPRIQGPFLILSTPFTAAGAVDFDALASQACYVDWCGCPGMIWPQSGDSVDLLTTDEKLKGIEVLAKTARKLNTTALCLGVQGKDTAEMLMFAEHVENWHRRRSSRDRRTRENGNDLRSTGMPWLRSRNGPSSSRRPAEWRTRGQSLPWTC